MTFNIDGDAKIPAFRRNLAAIHSFPEMGEQPQQEDDMKSLLLGSAASMLVASLAFAQQPTAPSHPAAPGAMPPPSVSTVTVKPSPAPGSVGAVGSSTSADSSAMPTSPRIESGKATASGDKNQAVATTAANASQPAKGANSFTEAEARRRLEAAGLSRVTGLTKDADGVWRGRAQKKAGGPVDVWLDYKGNTGLKV